MTHETQDADLRQFTVSVRGSSTQPSSTGKSSDELVNRNPAPHATQPLVPTSTTVKVDVNGRFVNRRS
jgi:hypothetical protein